MEQNVYVANIQNMCVHDGPGIRTTVFFMGCPLRCKWCQNPENLVGKPVILYEEQKCIQCGACVSACPYDVNTITKDGLYMQRQQCVGCRSCEQECLVEARQLCGTSMSPSALFDEVMKDEVFFRTSGGGITVSGGEPTMYPAYMDELFRLFHAKGIHVTMETCGFCDQDILAQLKDHVDLFLFDYKADTEAVHKAWTEQSNRIIKANLEYLLQKKQRVIIRIPLIPSVNDGEEFIHMMEYLHSLHQIKEVHILPFHQIGSSKYSTSDVPYEMGEVAECSAENAKQCAEVAQRYGFEVNIGGWNVA